MEDKHHSNILLEQNITIANHYHATDIIINNNNSKNISSSVDNYSTNYDMYLLALSWAPRFCCLNNKQCKKESIDHINDLTPHGLWPAYIYSTKYPSYCKEYINESELKVLTPRQKHEYEKHGSCSLLNVDAYFQQESRAQKLPNILTLREFLKQSAGGIVDMKSLHIYGGMKKIAVLSSKFCQLQEVTLCYKRNLLDNTIGDQIDCPSHVMNGSRNSSLQYNCNQVYLDKEGSCAFISKTLLESLKSSSTRNK